MGYCIVSLPSPEGYTRFICDVTKAKGAKTTTCNAEIIRVYETYAEALNEQRNIATNFFVVPGGEARRLLVCNMNIKSKITTHKSLEQERLDKNRRYRNTINNKMSSIEMDSIEHLYERLKDG